MSREEDKVIEQKERSITPHNGSSTLTLTSKFKNWLEAQKATSLIVTTFETEDGHRYLLVGKGKSELELVAKEREKDKKQAETHGET
jgi:hypothetical protein